MYETSFSSDKQQVVDPLDPLSIERGVRPPPIFIRPHCDPSHPRRLRSPEGSHITTCQQTGSLDSRQSSALHKSQSAASLDYQQYINSGFEGIVPVCFEAHLRCCNCPMKFSDICLNHPSLLQIIIHFTII